MIDNLRIVLRVLLACAIFPSLHCNAEESAKKHALAEDRAKSSNQQFQRPPVVPLPGVPSGFRSVTVLLNEKGPSANAEGDLVDVIWITKIKGVEQKNVIVEKVKILQIQDRNNGREATLMVSVEDAQKIQLAQVSGTLTLTKSGV